MSHKMSDAEVQVAIVDLPEWKVIEGKLHREYEFADFVHAFGFMATASMAIEKMNHHPEWFNVYDKVEVTLATHDAGGVTDRDVELAAAMDRLAGSAR